MEPEASHFSHLLPVNDGISNEGGGGDREGKWDVWGRGGYEQWWHIMQLSGDSVTQVMQYSWCHEGSGPIVTNHITLVSAH